MKFQICCFDAYTGKIESLKGELLMLQDQCEVIVELESTQRLDKALEELKEVIESRPLS